MRAPLRMVIGAVLIATWTAPSATAQAAAAPQLTVAPLAGPPGATVKVTGAGFCATGCSAVDVSFGGATVRTGVHVGAGGHFHTTFTVPATALGGTNNVFAEQRDGSGSDRQASTAFQVTPSTPVKGSSPHRASPAPRHKNSPQHTTAPTRTVPRTSRHHGTPPTTTTPRHAATASDAAPSTAPVANATAAAASHRSDRGFAPWWWIPIGIAVAAATAGTIIWRRRATG